MEFSVHWIQFEETIYLNEVISRVKRDCDPMYGQYSKSYSIKYVLNMQWGKYWPVL